MEGAQLCHTLSASSADDTSDYSHISKYLQEVASETVHSTEKQFACKIDSFVTDNTVNFRLLGLGAAIEFGVDHLQKNAVYQIE